MPPCDDAGVPTPDLLASLTLVVGDEELLVSRAVSAVVAAARARTTEFDVRELAAGSLQPGDLAELLSPSLFGDERVLVIQAGQDLTKEAAAEPMSRGR